MKQLVFGSIVCLLLLTGTNAEISKWPTGDITDVTATQRDLSELCVDNKIVMLAVPEPATGLIMAIGGVVVVFGNLRGLRVGKIERSKTR